MKNQNSKDAKPLHSPAFLKKRKFLVVLPLLVLPFLSMTFWALGGGRNSPSKKTTQEVKGLNLTLPDAQFKNAGGQSKLQIYQETRKDSTSSEGTGLNFMEALNGPAPMKSNTADATAIPQAGPTTTDIQENKIQEKLQQLNRQISVATTSSYTTQPQHDASFNHDVERLNQLMKTMKSGSQADPEMKQLSDLLQQVSEVQHPGQTDGLPSLSLLHRQRVYPVTAVRDTGEDKTLETNAFLTAKSQRQIAMPNNTIPAVVHEDQTLVSGATVKLRLTEAVYIDGNLIPKGSFIYGTCALNNERLLVKVASVRYLNNILPVSLTVYDLDGQEGLFVPGSISRDAAKEGATNAVQSLQLLSMNQGLGAQAAGAGIEAAKGLFGRKVRQVKVKVKAGYQVLLKDNNQKD